MRSSGSSRWKKVIAEGDRTEVNEDQSFWKITEENEDQNLANKVVPSVLDPDPDQWICRYLGKLKWSTEIRKKDTIRFRKVCL